MIRIINPVGLYVIESFIFPSFTQMFHGKGLEMKEFDYGKLKGRTRDNEIVIKVADIH